jgi:hypothetical protein
LVSLLAALSLFALAACSGNSSPACTNGTACGGDVVGTWNVVSSCVNETTTNVATCGTTTGAVDAQLNGTIVFNEDSSYLATLSYSGTAQTTAPIACLTPTAATTCDDVQQYQQSNESTSLGSHLDSVSCTAASGGACTCTVTVTGVPDANNQKSTGNSGTIGTYTLSQKTISLSSSPITSTMGYCVSGNQLTMIPQGTNDGTFSATYSGSLVLQKQ